MGKNEIIVTPLMLSDYRGFNGLSMPRKKNERKNERKNVDFNRLICS
jgi:hypothetical protein